ncbi:mitochondrial outer membrane protein SLC25A46-like [Diadema setosum]|uniref:mitochondrial outer membrane protein SLC25A46-like n=1 Tax=Diadema setosum TaxID=31175 RepID=UPI003B3AEE36
MTLRRIPGATEEETSSKAQEDSISTAQDQIMAAVRMATPNQQQNENIQRFAGFGIGLASLLTENILSHPFIVFRRQCQVNHHAHRYHIHPFSVIPVIVTLQRQHGFFTMWKGIGSAFMVQGIGLGSESLISEFTPFPREVHSYSTIKQFMGHVTLKMASIAITTPFLAASLVESVQSDIASDRPGVFDCIKEGFCRLVGWGSSSTTRLLPIYTLLFPTVLHGILKYFITSTVQFIVLAIHRQKLRDAGRDRLDAPATPGTMKEAYFPELVATFAGNLTADVILYPLETIIVKLHIQGTRTIIDNTDNGTGVVPISTQFEGVSDCLRGILEEEGVAGLFKGFGALVVQYLMYAAVLKLTHFVYQKLMEDFVQREHRS